MEIILVFGILTGIWTATLATGKGYDGVPAFAVGFVLSFVGVIIYAMIPHRHYYCSHCGERNHHSQSNCRRCGVALPHHPEARPSSARTPSFRERMNRSAGDIERLARIDEILKKNS